MYMINKHIYVGYEVSQANAAFVIRRKLSSAQPIIDHHLVLSSQPLGYFIVGLFCHICSFLLFV
jgi:hypothetical protein